MVYRITNKVKNDFPYVVDDEAIYCHKKGITAMQKLLGKSRFEDLLEAYIEKPQGKPTLVPESDKRPAMNTAKNDFMEEYDNE